MEFKPQEHVIIMERKSKNKETNQWVTTQTEYLPVQWRIFWFRIDNPKGKIDSHALTLDLERGAAIFETYVEREDGGSARMHGSETAGDWKDYIEKAQTKSLGRALATWFAPSQYNLSNRQQSQSHACAHCHRPHARRRFQRWPRHAQDRVSGRASRSSPWDCRCETRRCATGRAGTRSG